MKPEKSERNIGEDLTQAAKETVFRISIVFLLFHAPIALPASINFSGALDVVLEDTGSAVYSGSSVGATFSGTIDDVTGVGQISDGTTTTSFSCCTLAASSPDISNDQQLNAEDAALLNAVAGSALFTAGQLIDSVNLEGDAMTSSGGRIEIGLSFILKPDAFNDEQPGNYPFETSDTLLTLFFILEEDASGDTDIFDVFGGAVIEGSTPSSPDSGTELPSTSGQLLARDLDGDSSTAEAYYDSALGITWLKDTNLALSESFDVPNIRTDGGMNFTTAQLWVNTMNSASYLGYTGWRMPTLTPVAGGDVYNNSYTNNATSDVGNAVTGVGWVDAAGIPASEVGHLFYVTLGNTGRYTPNADGLSTSQVENPAWGQINTGPFSNIELETTRIASYWNGLDNVSTVFNAPTGWYFLFSFGNQSVGTDQVSRLVWPVHDGDIGASLSDGQDTTPDESPIVDRDTNAESGGSGGGALNLCWLMIGLFLWARTINNQLT